jgi:hypothetical protein
MPRSSDALPQIAAGSGSLVISFDDAALTRG